MDVKKSGNGMQNADIAGDSPSAERSAFAAEDGNSLLDEALSMLPENARVKLTAGRDMKNFAKIFGDAAMMETADTFLGCGMNVCLAARKLYMHRNTLMYRLEKIKRLTGLDLRNFDMAVTFRILRRLYGTE